MPITMPTDGLTSANWQLAHRQTQQSTVDGRGNVLTFGPSFWMVEMSYTRLNELQFRTLQATINSAKGSIEEFTLWRPTRQNPYNFDASGASGVISVFSVDTGAKTATITVPGGNLVPGDFVQYTAATSGTYVGEVTAATNVTGTQTTVTLMPDPVTAHGTPAASVYRAEGSFRIASVQMQEPVGTGAGSITITFKQVTPEG